MTNDASATFTNDLVRFVRDDIAGGADLGLEADTDLVMSGLVDSLGVVLIVEHLEQSLGIRIDPVDVVIEHFASVSAMVSYLERRDDCTLVTGT